MAYFSLSSSSTNYDTWNTLCRASEIDTVTYGWIRKMLTYYFYGEETFELSGDRARITYSFIKWMSDQKIHLHNLIETSDVLCINIFCMDRLYFRRLCKLHEIYGGLQLSKNINISSLWRCLDFSVGF